MSLYGVMRLMGHRSVVTTLIYASVAQDTIRREYFTALDRAREPYEIPQQLSGATLAADNPTSHLEDAVRWLQKTGEPSTDRTRALIIKRLQRLKAEIEQLS